MVIDTKSTWVVLADTNSCRIYDYRRRPEHLLLVKEITHPENKLRDVDLISDKPGRYVAGDLAHGAYSQASDPKEIHIDNFSREIAKALDHGRATNAYRELIVISAPHMNGLLFQHVNKHVKDLVAHVIEKDVVYLKDRELLDFLEDHIY